MMRIRFPLPHLGGGWNEGRGFLAALLLATATGALAGPATPGIAVGDRHALVLQANGSVWAWGGGETLAAYLVAAR